MLVLFCAAGLVLLFLAFARRVRCRREAALIAGTMWGATIAIGTEILSLLHVLGACPVAMVWSAVCCGCAAWLAIERRRQARTKSAEAPPRCARGSVPASSWAVVAGIGWTLAAIGLVAVVAPPNNHDSMTYHMSRIMHWMQNGTVAHYPTHIDRQLFQGPMAEFAIMHLQLLVGGDRLANLVQWLAMAGCVAGVSLIAKRLGAGLPGQLLAAAACVTIPMGVLQGSSTQNDLVLAFWLVCLFNFVLGFGADGRPSHAVHTGIALGLACLTKGTAYPYVLPIMVWFSLKAWKQKRWAATRPLVVVGLVALVLVLPHSARNQRTYGSPLAPDYRSRRYRNEVVSVRVFLSNVLRNSALHLACPSDAANQKYLVGPLLTTRGRAASCAIAASTSSALTSSSTLSPCMAWMTRPSWTAALARSTKRSRRSAWQALRASTS